MNINQHTRQLERLTIEIVQMAEENKKEYFIGGGLAIDFFCGKISRNHHDIDFHPMLEDSEWWIRQFQEKGYVIKNRSDEQFPETWWVFHSNGKFMIDMWPFRLNNGVLFINKQGKYVDSGRHWLETKVINVKHVKIRVENPYRVLEQKTRHVCQGQAYRSVDIHDFKLLGRSPRINCNRIVSI